MNFSTRISRRRQLFKWLPVLTRMAVQRGLANARLGARVGCNSVTERYRSAGRILVCATALVASTSSIDGSAIRAVAGEVVGESPSCAGDCNGNGRVSVEELIRGVAIALGRGEASSCVNVDGNRDGSVSIGELIAAVSSALDGCRCPFDFLDDRAGQDQACVFSGRWNSECGGSDLPATFTVLDGLVGVAIVTGSGSPTLNFFAEASTDREAELVGFTFGDDAEQITGALRLSEDGRALTVAPSVDIGVAIDECAFETYEGEIAQIVSTGAENVDR